MSSPNPQESSSAAAHESSSNNGGGGALLTYRRKLHNKARIVSSTNTAPTVANSSSSMYGLAASNVTTPPPVLREEPFLDNHNNHNGMMEMDHNTTAAFPMEPQQEQSTVPMEVEHDYEPSVSSDSSSSSSSSPTEKKSSEPQQNDNNHDNNHDDEFQQVVRTASQDHAISDNDDDDVCCNACGMEPSYVPDGMLACQRCKRTRYCSVECLSWDWEQGGHRDTCVGDHTQRRRNSRIRVDSDRDDGGAAQPPMSRSLSSSPVQQPPQRPPLQQALQRQQSQQSIVQLTLPDQFDPSHHSDGSGNSFSSSSSMGRHRNNNSQNENEEESSTLDEEGSDSLTQGVKSMDVHQIFAPPKSPVRTMEMMQSSSTSISSKDFFVVGVVGNGGAATTESAMNDVHADHNLHHMAAIQLWADSTHSIELLPRKEKTEATIVSKHTLDKEESPLQAQTPHQSVATATRRMSWEEAPEKHEMDVEDSRAETEEGDASHNDNNDGDDSIDDLRDINNVLAQQTQTAAAPSSPRPKSTQQHRPKIAPSSPRPKPQHRHVVQDEEEDDDDDDDDGKRIYTIPGESNNNNKKPPLRKSLAQHMGKDAEQKNKDNHKDAVNIEEDSFDIMNEAGGDSTDDSMLQSIIEEDTSISDEPEREGSWRSRDIGFYSDSSSNSINKSRHESLLDKKAAEDAAATPLDGESDSETMYDVITVNSSNLLAAPAAATSASQHQPQQQQQVNSTTSLHSSSHSSASPMVPQHQQEQQARIPASSTSSSVEMFHHPDNIIDPSGHNPSGHTFSSFDDTTGHSFAQDSSHDNNNNGNSQPPQQPSPLMGRRDESESESFAHDDDEYLTSSPIPAVAAAMAAISSPRQQHLIASPMASSKSSSQQQQQSPHSKQSPAATSPHSKQSPFSSTHSNKQSPRSLKDHLEDDTDSPGSPGSVQRFSPPQSVKNRQSLLALPSIQLSNKDSDVSALGDSSEADVPRNGATAKKKKPNKSSGKSVESLSISGLQQQIYDDSQSVRSSSLSNAVSFKEFRTAYSAQSDASSVGMGNSKDFKFFHQIYHSDEGDDDGSSSCGTGNLAQTLERLEYGQQKSRHEESSAVSNQSTRTPMSRRDSNETKSSQLSRSDALKMSINKALKDYEMLYGKEAAQDAFQSLAKSVSDDDSDSKNSSSRTRNDNLNQKLPLPPPTSSTTTKALPPIGSAYTASPPSSPRSPRRSSTMSNMSLSSWAFPVDPASMFPSDSEAEGETSQSASSPIKVVETKSTPPNTINERLSQLQEKASRMKDDQQQQESPVSDRQLPALLSRNDVNHPASPGGLDGMLHQLEQTEPSEDSPRSNLMEIDDKDQSDSDDFQDALMLPEQFQGSEGAGVIKSEQVPSSPQSPAAEPVVVMTALVHVDAPANVSPSTAASSRPDVESTSNGGIMAAPSWGSSVSRTSVSLAASSTGDKEEGPHYLKYRSTLARSTVASSQPAVAAKTAPDPPADSAESILAAPSWGSSGENRTPLSLAASSGDGEEGPHYLRYRSALARSSVTQAAKAPAVSKSEADAAGNGSILAAPSWGSSAGGSRTSVSLTTSSGEAEEGPRYLRYRSILARSSVALANAARLLNFTSSEEYNPPQMVESGSTTPASTQTTSPFSESKEEEESFEDEPLQFTTRTPERVEAMRISLSTAARDKSEPDGGYQRYRSLLAGKVTPEVTPVGQLQHSMDEEENDTSQDRWAPVETPERYKLSFTDGTSSESPQYHIYRSSLAARLSLAREEADDEPLVLVDEDESHGEAPFIDDGGDDEEKGFVEDRLSGYLTKYDAQTSPQYIKTHKRSSWIGLGADLSSNHSDYDENESPITVRLSPSESRRVASTMADSPGRSSRSAARLPKPRKNYDTEVFHDDYDPDLEAGMFMDRTPLIHSHASTDSGSEKDFNIGGRRNNKRCFRFVALLVCLLLLLAGGGVVVWIFMTDDDNDEGPKSAPLVSEPTEPPAPAPSPSQNPTPSPTNVPTLTPTSTPSMSPSASPSFSPSWAPSDEPSSSPTMTYSPTLEPTDQLVLLSSASSDGGAALQQSGSAQNRAYTWLLGSNLTDMSNATIIQRYALATMYYSLDGEHWAEQNGWLTEDDECTWYFDSSPCENGVVVTLDLGFNGLGGEIPNEIALFQNVTTINLSGGMGSKIGGELPRTLALLSKLERFTVTNNEISGEIPAGLNWPQLSSLDVSRNKLTGSVPADIGLLVSLTSLVLASNELSGSLPASIGNLTNVEDMDLSDNKFENALPETIGDLVNLHTLKLDSNHFTWLPSSMGNLANLVTFVASNNNLTGPLFDAWATMDSLQDLDLSHNEITGQIPPSMGSLSSIHILNLSFNQFNGTIPDELGNLTSLYHLFLNGNQLSGSIPSALSGLEVVSILRVDDNDLNGTVPDLLCDTLGQNNVPKFYLDCNATSSEDGEVGCPLRACCTHCCTDGAGCGCVYENDLPFLC